MKKLAGNLAALAMILFMLAACGGLMRPYVSATTILANYWEAYLDLRDSMPEGEARDALRAKFKDTGETSIFTEASEALKIWKSAIGDVTEAEKRLIYKKILDRIVTLLLNEGIVKVE